MLTVYTMNEAQFWKQEVAKASPVHKKENIHILKRNILSGLTHAVKRWLHNVRSRSRFENFYPGVEM